MVTIGVTITEDQRHLPPPTHPATVIAIVGNANGTGADAADASVPANGLYQVEDPTNHKFGTGGSIPKALAAIAANHKQRVLVYRTADTATEAEMTKGFDALRTAETVFDIKPGIIVPLHLTWEIVSLNPTNTASSVVTELDTLCGQLDAVGIADAAPAPSANDLATAVTFVSTWADNNHGANGDVIGVYPRVENTAGSPEPLAPYYAGALAARDGTGGRVWLNPNLLSLKGITGLERVAPWYIDHSSPADTLVGKNLVVATRHHGWQALGTNMLVDPTSTDYNRYVNVKRTSNLIKRHLNETSLEYLKRNIDGDNFYDLVRGSTQAYLDRLATPGVRGIREGEVTVPEEVNTPQARAAGDSYFDIAYTPLFPARRVNFRVLQRLT